MGGIVFTVSFPFSFRFGFLATSDSGREEARHSGQPQGSPEYCQRVRWSGDLLAHLFPVPVAVGQIRKWT